jgi:excisionase family DNA binding protein
MLCSIKEAASILGVGRTFAYSLIKKGQLETVKLGGRHLVTLSSINALVETAKGGAA